MDKISAKKIAVKKDVIASRIIDEIKKQSNDDNYINELQVDITCKLAALRLMLFSDVLKDKQNEILNLIYDNMVELSDDMYKQVKEKENVDSKGLLSNKENNDLCNE